MPLSNNERPALGGVKPCPCGMPTDQTTADGVICLLHRHNGNLYELSRTDVSNAVEFVEVWNRFQDDSYGKN